MFFSDAKELSRIDSGLPFEQTSLSLSFLFARCWGEQYVIHPNMIEHFVSWIQVSLAQFNQFRFCVAIGPKPLILANYIQWNEQKK